MILIPEIETVVILVPRTGSSSLRRAVVARYPKAMMIYRHMEADGVPAGYDMWPKIGVVRHPVDRLWSLYKFLGTFGGAHDPSYIADMRRQVERPFADWLLNNETVFTSPYDRANQGRYYPQFNVRHPIPENRKSQWMYLRPDLGTTVYPFRKLRDLERRLDVTLEDRHNVTDRALCPPIGGEATEYLRRVFDWDFSMAYDV